MPDGVLRTKAARPDPTGGPQPLEGPAGVCLGPIAPDGTGGPGEQAGRVDQVVSPVGPESDQPVDFEDVAPELSGP